MLIECPCAGKMEVELSRAGRLSLTLAIAWLATSPAGGVEIVTGAHAPVGCLEETAQRFVPVVSWHAARYDALEARDLYKLLHQAVAGPGHAIRDPEMARSWLVREWSSLGAPHEEEQVLEPLTGDGRLVRLNLRPWRAAGRDAEEVLVAFLRTAETVSPTESRIRAEMDAIRACSATLAAPAGIEEEDFASFFAEQAAADYPAVHHSAGYSSAYDPAYRVVLGDLVR
ncbi:MAG: hypothetical protein P8125_06245 [Gemmatimonadota bacterium]|jgi:hypothetical protein